jgi:hypothetical protein
MYELPSSDDKVLNIDEKNVAEAETILHTMREKWGDLDTEVIHATWDFEELLNEKEGVI